VAVSKFTKHGKAEGEVAGGLEAGAWCLRRLMAMVKGHALESHKYLSRRILLKALNCITGNG
jgi:hypothetical protein